MEKLSSGEIIFNTIAIVGFIITVYGFIEKSPYKIIWIVNGVILIGAYLIWY